MILPCSVKKVLFAITLLLYQNIARASVSPNDFGFESAKNGVERFWAIYNAHVEAVRRNTNVSYRGVSDFTLEIPSDAKTIPLTNYTDFNGVKIDVINNSKDFLLIALECKVEAINIEKRKVKKNQLKTQD